MSNKPAFNLKVLLGALFAILVTVSGLASCGGASVSQNQATGVSPPSTTAVSVVVSASATPAIITSGSSAVVTWSSVYSTSCSASNGLGGAGTTGSFSTGALTTNTTYTITCVGPTGTTSQSTMVAVANTPTLTAILNASNAWANTPVRTGPVYYYCDCGTGADSQCVAGNDANAGTNKSAPRQTIASAVTMINSFTTGANNTVALCKGGAFNANPSGALFYGLYLAPTNCTAGTTCTDLREYASPVFTSSAKPIINAPVNTAGINLLAFNGNLGGIRILNIKLQGDPASIDENGAGTHGIFMINGAHDITVGDVTVDSFTFGLYPQAGTPTIAQNSNLVMTGNTITNSSAIGFLGAGLNSQISNNYFDGNGGHTKYDHSIYVSNEYGNMTNMSLVGNYIHGQYGSTCNGVVFTVNGGQHTNLTMSNNTIDIEPSAFTGGCYGMGVGNGLYPTPTIYTNVTISGNNIRNGGNSSIVMSGCAGCLISDNVISYDVGLGVDTKPVAITVPYTPARTGDQTNTGTRVLNNTVWLGPNSIGGITGVLIRTEGTGYIVANNTINYTSTNAGGWGGVNCFTYSLPLSSFTFIDNNHCNSAAPYVWETTNGATLAAWQTYSSFDTHSIQILPNFKSTTIPYNFQPNTPSPLLGAGSAIYAPTTATDITGTPWSSSPAIGAYE